jgi:hypothetical protein
LLLIHRCVSLAAADQAEERDELWEAHALAAASTGDGERRLRRLRAARTGGISYLHADAGLNA